MSILLGFEIPSGARVEVPEREHYCFTGQTQKSGKTTTAEALIVRSGLTAIAFVTKRGESSFVTARHIDPFFAEPTNTPEQPLWRWVQSILEASQKRTLKFEESWIITACEKPRQAKTLSDVHANIVALLEGERGPVTKKGKERKWLRKPVTGLNAGIYTSLRAYFDIVMPQLRRLPYSKKLQLHPGVNVMDLTAYSDELAMLVMRSVLEEVYLHRRNTVVIIPEAAKFIPLRRGTPVRLAAELFIRQGLGIGNCLWIDSQDLANVATEVLKSVTVWLLGRQRELNEVKRMVEMIPAHPRVPMREIQQLGKGQFIAIYEDQVRKVYVQPAWMDSEIHAQAIARGDESVESARQILRTYVKERKEMPDEDANEDRDPGPARPARSDSETDAAASDESAAVGEFERVHDPNHPSAEQELDGSEANHTEEIMWKERYDELKEKYDQLEQTHDALAERLRKIELGGSGASAAVAGKASPSAEVAEARGSEKSTGTRLAPAPTPDGFSEPLYQAFRTRLRRDPETLRLTAESPRIELKVERPVLELTTKTLKGMLAKLIHEGFFREPKTASAAYTELADRRRFRTAKPNVYRECDEITRMGYLVAVSDGYQVVPGMKIVTKEA